jgi:hypothetical protein
MEKPLYRDLKTLAVFIEMYCHCKHPTAFKAVTCLKTHDVTAIAGHELKLCEPCYRLLAHAFTKRTHCPMNPKPTCKHCPNHCYATLYRQQIRDVMKFSGMRSVLTGRLDYLVHLLF